MPNDDVAGGEASGGEGELPGVGLRDVLLPQVGSEASAYGSTGGGGVVSINKAGSAAGDDEVPIPPEASKSPESDEWSTPLALFNHLDALYGPFDLDLAASEANHKCLSWIGRSGTHLSNSIEVDWNGVIQKTAWCNPPYSRGNQEAFTDKAVATAKAGKRVVMLVQSAVDTAWFHRNTWAGRDLISSERVMRGPLKGQHFKLIGDAHRVDLFLLEGRIAFCDPVTGVPRKGNTGTMGSAVIVYTPMRLTPPAPGLVV